MNKEVFEEWKKQRYPDGCIIKILYGKGANIERPLEEAFLAGLKAGKEQAKKEIEAELLKCYQGYPEEQEE